MLTPVYIAVTDKCHAPPPLRAGAFSAAAPRSGPMARGRKFHVRESSRIPRNVEARIAYSAASQPYRPAIVPIPLPCTCLLYTSDAADDLLCVDLGGRRIIKKKKRNKMKKK